MGLAMGGKPSHPQELARGLARELARELARGVQGLDRGLARGLDRGVDRGLDRRGLGRGRFCAIRDSQVGRLGDSSVPGAGGDDGHANTDLRHEPLAGGSAESNSFPRWGLDPAQTVRRVEADYCAFHVHRKHLSYDGHSPVCAFGLEQTLRL